MQYKSSKKKKPAETGSVVYVRLPSDLYDGVDKIRQSNGQSWTGLVSVLFKELLSRSK